MRSQARRQRGPGITVPLPFEFLPPFSHKNVVIARHVLIGSGRLLTDIGVAIFPQLCLSVVNQSLDPDFPLASGLCAYRVAGRVMNLVRQRLKARLRRPIDK